MQSAKLSSDVLKQEDVLLTDQQVHRLALDFLAAYRTWMAGAPELAALAEHLVAACEKRAAAAS